MKKTILTNLAFILTFIVVSIGFGLFQFFLKNNFSFWPFIVGMIGYFIVIRPAVNYWESKFMSWFKINE